MKTAEKWSKCLTNGKLSTVKALLRAIQLDALKEGMRRAATIRQEWHDKYYPNPDKLKAGGVQTILDAAEQLTVKDLNK